MPMRSRIDPFNCSPKLGISLFLLTWGSPVPRSSIVIRWSRALLDIAAVPFTTLGIAQVNAGQEARWNRPPHLGNK